MLALPARGGARASRRSSRCSSEPTPRAARRLRRGAPRDPRRRVRQVRAAGVRKGDARPLRERPPAAGLRGGAAPALRHARSATSLDQATGDGPGDGRGLAGSSRVGGVVTEPRPSLHQAGRADGDVHARGPRGRDRGLRLPEDDGRVRHAPRGGRDRLRAWPPRRPRRRGRSSIAMEITARARPPTTPTRRSRWRCRSAR